MSALPSCPASRRAKHRRACSSAPHSPCCCCSPPAAGPATCSTTTIAASSTGTRRRSARSSRARRRSRAHPVAAAVVRRRHHRRRARRRCVERREGDGARCARASTTARTRALSDRIRDALERHRESPLRFGAIVGGDAGAARRRCRALHLPRRRQARLGARARHAAVLPPGAAHRPRSRACSTSSASNLNGDPVDRRRHPRARRQAAARGEAEGARDRVADERRAGQAGQDRRRLSHALGRAAEGAPGAARRRRREGALVAVDGSWAR